VITETLTTVTVNYRDIDKGEMFNSGNRDYVKNNDLQAYDIETHAIKEFGHRSQVGRPIITKIDLKPTH
jgi:hypothetical protein